MKYKQSLCVCLFPPSTALSACAAHICLSSRCIRINCSQACGPFVNYTTSWEALPTAVSQLPHGLQTLLYMLSSEAFAVSFFVVTWYDFLCGGRRPCLSCLTHQ